MFLEEEPKPAVEESGVGSDLPAEANGPPPS